MATETPTEDDAPLPRLAVVDNTPPPPTPPAHSRVVIAAPAEPVRVVGPHGKGWDLWFAAGRLLTAVIVLLVAVLGLGAQGVLWLADRVHDRAGAMRVERALRREGQS